MVGVVIAIESAIHTVAHLGNVGEFNIVLTNKVNQAYTLKDKQT